VKVRSAAQFFGVVRDLLGRFRQLALLILATCGVGPLLVPLCPYFSFVGFVRHLLVHFWLLALLILATHGDGALLNPRSSDFSFVGFVRHLLGHFRLLAHLILATRGVDPLLNPLSLAFTFFGFVRHLPGHFRLLVLLILATRGVGPLLDPLSPDFTFFGFGRHLLVHLWLLALLFHVTRGVGPLLIPLCPYFSFFGFDKDLIVHLRQLALLNLATRGINPLLNSLSLSFNFFGFVTDLLDRVWLLDHGCSSRLCLLGLVQLGHFWLLVLLVLVTRCVGPYLYPPSPDFTINFWKFQLRNSRKHFDSCDSSSSWSSNFWLSYAFYSFLRGFHQLLHFTKFPFTVVYSFSFWRSTRNQACPLRIFWKYWGPLACLCHLCTHLAATGYQVSKAHLFP